MVRDPSLPYEIDHHLASQDFTKLEKAAVELVKEGYHVDDADEFEDEQGERWFAFAASVDVELDESVLAVKFVKLQPLLMSAVLSTTAGELCWTTTKTSLTRTTGKKNRTHLR